MRCEVEHKIFSAPPEDFEANALAVFRFQYQHNPIYQQYVKALSIRPDTVQQVTEIPFLPVSFFKTHEVKTGFSSCDLCFESSGTTGVEPSRHWVRDPQLYRDSFLKGFQLFYGPPEHYCVLGLLPSYLERQHSSLIYMVDHLQAASQHPFSGFYLYDHDRLARVLDQLESQQQPTLLFGVTYALLDFAQHFPCSLSYTTLIETGGMKGRSPEWTRAQVHEQLQRAFVLPAVHSEYGMTELLSQAYSRQKGLFYCPPWMQVLVREEDDPLVVHHRQYATGVINVIDLANLYSCSFIATDDVGRLHEGGAFEVLGRLDHSDLRGCSLLTV